MTIERPKPIVDQVAELLRRRINTRQYAPGARLPSENELAQELAVSRSTVRTVLARFAAEGLILRKQGDGTYVNERIDDVNAHYGGIWDFSRLIAANGYRPSIRTLSLVERPATAAEAAELELAAEAPVIAMARLFYADGRPVIYASNIFARASIKVAVERLDGDLPIHDIVTTYCDDQIAYVISDIAATAAARLPAELPANAEGGPLLQLQETFYNKEHRPLILGVSSYDFTVIKLRLVQAWG